MRLVVFISGRGSNLKALLKAQEDFEVVHVICNQATASGLAIAEEFDVDYTVIPWKDKTQAEITAHKLLLQLQPDLIVLAGFMRVLSAQFVSEFNHQIINIHPSLLPLYPGLDTHQRALDDKQKIYGATVHFVDHQLDGGQIISQCRLTIQSNDTAETLAQRLLSNEHQLLVKTVQHMANHTIYWHNDRLYYNDKPLIEPIIWNQ